MLGPHVAAARRMNAVSIRAEQSGLFAGSFSRQRPINSLNSGDHAPSFGSVGASASLIIVLGASRNVCLAPENCGHRSEGVAAATLKTGRKVCTEYGSTEPLGSFCRGARFEGLHDHHHRKGDILVDTESESKREQAKINLVYVCMGCTHELHGKTHLMECRTPQ